MRDDDLLIGIGPDGEAYPVHAPRSVERDRGRGALLGLAVGDALGTTLEFKAFDVPHLPQLLAGPHTELRGGGPFNVLPGQVTDDTQMATCLCASLMAQGQLVATELAQRYVTWVRQAFDAGSQTREALDRVARGQDPVEAGRLTWVVRNRNAAGNGSLMRTVPIGVFSADLANNRRIQAMTDSAITHFDPRCQLACVAFDAAIAAGVTGAAAPLDMLAAAQADLAPAVEFLRDRYPAESTAIDSAQGDLLRDLDRAGGSDPKLYGSDTHLLRHAGFVRVAFRLAFWHLLHTQSFEEALVDVVNRGGDADTNAAITGALLGAFHGEGAIPQRWRSAVLECAPPSPWGDTYHPRRLLELIG